MILSPEKEGIILKQGKQSLLSSRHHWIFSGAIHSYPSSFQEGHIYPIYDDNHHLLGHGYFRSQGTIRGRVISFGHDDPWQAITCSLDRAIALRHSLFTPLTNSYRLINAEGDFLPGLVIDQYADTLILQSSTIGMDLLIEPIANYLIAKKQWKNLYEKSTSSARRLEKLTNRIRVLYGNDEPLISIKENGICFSVDWKEGQKSGFFLDQREMRTLIGKLSTHKTVLNCFCYTGGFSIYALKANASHVTSLDSSQAALKLLNTHLKQNQIDLSKHTSIQTDVFAFLTQEPLEEDIVVLDPPAFVKKKEDLPSGMKGYRQLNTMAMKKMKKNSLLLTCSCSHFMSLDQFKTLLFQAARQAKRNIQILSIVTHSMDHPISLFHPEGDYLKNILLALY